MNEERKQTHWTGFKLLMAALIGWLYSLAGRGTKVPVLGKIRRRVWLPFIACSVLTGEMFLFNKFSWLLLGAIWASWGVYYANMSIFAYGADSWLRKIFRRIGQQFICGAVHGGSCILIAVITGNWGIYTLSVLSGALCLGFLGGIFDTDVSAAQKEGVTGCSIFLFALFLL